MIARCSEIKHPTADGLPCAVLQYANATLIVLQGNTTGAAALKNILDNFASFSGLHINYSKSTLVPIHMTDIITQECVQVLGCRQESFPQPYLGLPLSVHKLPLSAYTPYIQKTDRYLSTWQASFLNPMGRAVMVNSVLDSQLVYFMSSLQLPPSVIDQLDRRRRAFLWSADKTGKSKPANCLVAWINVCKPRDLGGLGIKDMGTQNICLLLKLIHKLHHPEFFAWAQWVQGRASIATLSGDIHGDHWQVLRQILPLYQAITTVALGDGNSCSFWSDVWTEDEALADTYPALFSHCTFKEATVFQMLQTGLQQTLVSRLSQRASLDMHHLL
jgi:hypothetical protein